MRNRRPVPKTILSVDALLAQCNELLPWQRYLIQAWVDKAPTLLTRQVPTQPGFPAQQPSPCAQCGGPRKPKRAICDKCRGRNRRAAKLQSGQTPQFVVFDEVNEGGKP